MKKHFILLFIFILVTGSSAFAVGLTNVQFEQEENLFLLEENCDPNKEEVKLSYIPLKM